MTLLSPDKALFRDDAGHQVLFRLRPGAQVLLARVLMSTRARPDQDPRR